MAYETKSGKPKLPLTDEQLAMLDQLVQCPNLKTEPFNEVDFVTKLAKWKAFGATEGQGKALYRCWADHFKQQDAGSPTPADDSGLQGEYVIAEQTPEGYQLQIADGPIGPAVTRREALQLVPWMDKAILDIERIYGPPPAVEEVDPNREEPAAEGVASNDPF